MNKIMNYDIDLGELELALSERKLSKEEYAKQRTGLLGGEELRKELEDLSKSDVDQSLRISLKPSGIYIQFDRELIKYSVREWFFMVRDSVWGGGDITPENWLGISHLANLYSRSEEGLPSIRLTTRQNMQFHRVAKKNLIPLVRGLMETRHLTLNGCGDNARNPTACPYKSNIFDANALARKIGAYFQLPLSEYYKVYNEEGTAEPSNGFKYSEYGLPRKLKIAVGGYYYDEALHKEVRCNCNDILTSDISVAPIIKDKTIAGYQVYIGGSLGQKNGKPTFPSLSGPLGIFMTEEELMKGLALIGHVFQQVGDRKNRHSARLKNILIAKGLERSADSFESLLLDENIFNKVRKLGIDWYREQIEKLGTKIYPPIELDLGKVGRHHGWMKQFDGKWSYGLWIQNGRVSDSNPQGKVKSLIDEIVSIIKPTVRTQPTQDILFLDIDETSVPILEGILKKYNYGNYSKLRLNSEACVGLHTCPLAVTESEKYFQPLIMELEARGYANVEGVSIGISGCERHCSRNIRYGISIEGKGEGIYQLKLLFGKTDDDHLAKDIICDDKKFLRMVPKEYIPDLMSVLIDNYIENKKEEEYEISLFHKRIGMGGIVRFLMSNIKTAHLMQRVSDPYLT